MKYSLYIVDFRFCTHLPIGSLFLLLNLLNAIQIPKVLAGELSTNGLDSDLL